jgi:hypothetical protein
MFQREMKMRIRGKRFACAVLVLCAGAAVVPQTGVLKITIIARNGQWPWGNVDPPYSFPFWEKSYGVSVYNTSWQLITGERVTTFRKA